MSVLDRRHPEVLAKPVMRANGGVAVHVRMARRTVWGTLGMASRSSSTGTPSLQSLRALASGHGGMNLDGDSQIAKR